MTANDNATNIAVSSFDLNGSLIKDLAGNELVTTLPPVGPPGSNQVSIDNVVEVLISASNFNDGDITNVQRTDITVSGSDVTGFLYKLTSDPINCSDSADYIYIVRHYLT